MNNDKARFIAAMLILAAAAVLVVGRSVILKEREISVDITRFPVKIAAWHGLDVDFDPEVFEILETDAVLVRRYHKDAESISLAVVFYGDIKPGFHRPEACFVGQGSQIIERTVDSFSSGTRGIDVNRLILGGQEEDRVMVYFYQTGDFFTASYKDLRLRLVFDRLRARSHGAAMIQISAPAGTDPAATLARVKDFGRDLVPLLTEFFP